MHERITSISIPLDDINQLIEAKLGAAIESEPLPLINAAFLAILIDRQGPPDITIDELSEGIRLASGTITTYLSSLRPPAEGEVVH